MIPHSQPEYIITEKQIADFEKLAGKLPFPWGQMELAGLQEKVRSRPAPSEQEIWEKVQKFRIILEEESEKQKTAFRDCNPSYFSKCSEKVIVPIKDWGYTIQRLQAELRSKQDEPEVER